jgi:hypothetical protein
MIVTQKSYSARATAMRCASAIAVGSVLLAAPNAAFAGSTSSTRDHRDGKRPGGVAAEGGVTVNGKSTTVTKSPKLPVGTNTQGHGGGYGGLGNDPSKGTSGITVRDHR